MTPLLQAVISGVLLGGVIGLVSMGLSLVFGVMRIVNFAHGELVVLGMYGAFVLYSAFGLNPALAIPVLAPLLFLFGMVMYVLLFERIVTRATDLLPQLSLTVGISFLLQNVMQMVFSPTQKSITIDWTTTYFNLGEVFMSQAHLIAFAVSTVVMVLLWLFLARTDFGRSMRAMVDDNDVARMVGISSRKVYASAMGISSALAAVGGIILMIYYPVTPHTGILFLPLAFVAVVLGGMGNVLGAFVGGIIIGVVQQLTAVYVAYQLQNAGLLLVFIAILLVRPSGLFGKRGGL